jgi:hypothetical protein
MYEAVQTGYSANSDAKWAIIIFVVVMVLAFFWRR